MKLYALQAGVQDFCTCTSLSREGMAVFVVSEVRPSMLKDSECKPHVEGRSGNRVSSAVWPVNVRRVIATGKAAQRRRDWIMQGRWWVLLADALSLRILFVLTTVLVVISSLLVAILGLQFWYILLLPLLLFTLILFIPLFLAGRSPMEMVPPGLSSFAQELRSSTSLLSLYVQELKSSPGYADELRSEPGFPSSATPATPMPAAPPLIRVLETYDLREMRVEHFLKGLPAEETASYQETQPMERHFWHTIGTEPLGDRSASDDSLTNESRFLERDHPLDGDAQEDSSQTGEARDDSPQRETRENMTFG